MRKWPYPVLALVAVVLLCALFGCATPRRCARKFPATVVSDTLRLTQRDTVRIQGRERVDTLVNLRTLRDTTYLTTERVRVQWVRLNDTLAQLRVQCPDDTLRSQWVREYAARVVATPPAPGWTWLERVGILAIAAIALYVAFKLL
jgi:hypothetical protein